MTDANTLQPPYDDVYEPFERGFAFEQSAFRPQAEESYHGCTNFADQPNDQSSFEFDAFNYKYD